jgi:phosphatidylglycerol:prolipoprotein diacylglycerol transferase
VPLLLYIPWFQASALVIPLPSIAPITFLGHTFDFPPDVQIHPFGLLVATAVVLGAFVAERRARKVGLDPIAISGLSGHVIVGGFVIGHVVDSLAYHPDVVMERPVLVLEVWNGLSSFGGFLGAIVGALVWQHNRRTASGRPSIRVAADPIAFSFPFGWLFGRIGCFVTHDHPGRVTMFPLGVQDYAVGYPPYQVRHDLGLYEVIWCLAMIPLFLWLGRRERPRGLFLGLLPVLYAPVRFGLDFLRATDLDEADPRYFGLTPGHYGAIVLFGLGALVLWRTWRDPWPEVHSGIAARDTTDAAQSSSANDATTTTDPP